MRRPARPANGLFLVGVLTVIMDAQSACALSVTNIPAADASLMEVAPGNSMGGQTWVVSGGTQNGDRMRALYQFDLSSLPTNAAIFSVVLQLDCTGQSSEPACVTGAAFGLHRMLRPWGEGTNVPIQNPGQGLAAQPGDATWSYAFAPTNEWTGGGGVAGADYSPVESGFQYVSTPELSPYRFESTPELVDDVQTWVRQPAANFGWMLIGAAEDTICTAKRFNSREDPNSQPMLEVEYRVPPQFSAAQRVGSHFQIRFTPWPGQSYTVQFRTNLSNAPWQTLTNLGLVTNAVPISLPDTAGDAVRLYRIVSY